MVVVFSLLAISLLLWMFLGAIAIIVALVLGVSVLLVTSIELYRRTTRSSKEMTEQLMRTHASAQNKRIENLLSIFAFVEPKMPLPSTDRWTAAPDLLRVLVETTMRTKPSVVVEAGSGLSTLLVAYSLDKIGAGKIISLEQDRECFEKSKRMIAFHGLEGRAMVVHAPLVNTTINGNTWRWYDLEGIDLNGGIDLVLVDGPPQAGRKLARYPALPLLHHRLNREFTMILDDGSRRDEQQVVARWKREYPDIEFNYVDLEKGAFLIRRSERQP